LVHAKDLDRKVGLLKKCHAEATLKISARNGRASGSKAASSGREVGSLAPSFAPVSTSNDVTSKVTSYSRRPNADSVLVGASTVTTTTTTMKKSYGFTATAFVGTTETSSSMADEEGDVIHGSKVQELLEAARGVGTDASRTASDITNRSNIVFVRTEDSEIFVDHDEPPFVTSSPKRGLTRSASTSAFTMPTRALTKTASTTKSPFSVTQLAVELLESSDATPFVPKTKTMSRSATSPGSLDTSRMITLSAGFLVSEEGGSGRKQRAAAWAPRVKPPCVKDHAVAGSSTRSLF